MQRGETMTFHGRREGEKEAGNETDLVFTGCTATSAAQGAPQAGGRRREVRASG
jgi:hypothetical protein